MNVKSVVNRSGINETGMWIALVRCRRVREVMQAHRSGKGAAADCRERTSTRKFSVKDI